MLELKHIQKRYEYQKVLTDISMTFPDVGMVGIVGASGCGKSTLLNIIGGIDKDFLGDIVYNGQSVKAKLPKYRQKHISFIFQQMYLIMWLSVQENIKLSQYFHKQYYQKRDVDISQFKKLKMSSLSFGQRQKITYLRACCHYKDILLCDEPTGSLDPQSTQEIMALLKQESKNKLVIIVSHDMTAIKTYCDEIYQMRNGQIVNHYKQNQVFPSIVEMKLKEKKKKCPFLCLAWYSLLSNKKRMFQVIIGFSLALLCVLVTMTMGHNLEEKINQYIYSLIPPSSISVQSVQDSLDKEFIDTVKEIEGIDRVQLFLDDYEQLGIGFIGTRYQESQTLFIGDDTSPYEQLTLLYGHFPTNNHEIIVSKSTAQHLCQEYDCTAWFGKLVEAWYKHETKVESISYHVVGISQNTTSIDTFYQQSNAYIELLQEKGIMNEIKSHTGIVFVNHNEKRSRIIQKLTQKFPQYKFIETGTSTLQQVSSTMSKINVILWLFSSLAILSSLFLIGEVMFFNTIQKKKDYAIMRCFGARIIDFLRLIFCETIQIVGISLGIVFIIYMQMISVLNMVINSMAIYDGVVLTVDLSLFLIVSLLSFGLVLFSQIAPMLYIIKMNTVKALKD